MQVVEDADVELSCSIDANPQPDANSIKWVKDGTVLDNGEKLSMKDVKRFVMCACFILAKPRCLLFGVSFYYLVYSTCL